MITIENSTNDFKVISKVNDDLNYKLSEAICTILKEQSLDKMIKIKTYLKNTNSRVRESNAFNKKLIQNEDNVYDFEIIHDRYFVFKQSFEVYYAELFYFDFDPKLYPINLHLRNGYISQLAQTQKDNLLQFVYVQFTPVFINYIITWDLEKNAET